MISVPLSTSEQACGRRSVAALDPDKDPKFTGGSQMKHLTLLCMIVLLFGTAPVFTQAPNDVDALKGVETGKVVFDMNTADARKPPST